jgi:GT2 family glycosyltransferase
MNSTLAIESSIPAASVVIPTCNRVEELRALIDSLLYQTVPLEIMIMDDGKSEDTGRMLTQEFPDVRHYQIDSGRGPGFQRNRGIELARSNFVFPVDDDTYFTSASTVEQTLSEFNHPRVGAVGIPFINTRQDEVVRQRAPDDRSIYAVHAFVGAAHAMRRDLFLKLGGYREHFYYMGDEGDLCLRMLAAGYITRMGRADSIHHLESHRRDTSLADHYGRRNDVLFAWHNVPMPFLPLHLAATTWNGVRTALRADNRLRMICGIAAGYTSCLSNWSQRAPVSSQIYRLHRRLKKNGALPLKELEMFLPSLQPILFDKA